MSLEIPPPLKALLIECKVVTCADVFEAVKQACELAQQYQCNVRFDFNGVAVTVDPESDPYRIAEAQQAEQRRERAVGP